MSLQCSRPAAQLAAAPIPDCESQRIGSNGTYCWIPDIYLNWATVLALATNGGKVTFQDLHWVPPLDERHCGHQTSDAAACNNNSREPTLGRFCIQIDGLLRLHCCPITWLSVVLASCRRQISVR